MSIKTFAIYNPFTNFFLPLKRDILLNYFVLQIFFFFIIIFNFKDC